MAAHFSRRINFQGKKNVSGMKGEWVAGVVNFRNFCLKFYCSYHKVLNLWKNEIF